MAHNRASDRPETFDDAPFWANEFDPATLQKEMDERLAEAQRALDQMLSVEGKRTIDNTLQPYDQTLMLVDGASYQTDLIQNVHPDAEMRAAAEIENQKVSAFSTSLSLNHEVYNALAALDLDGADEVTRYYVEKTLRDFRLSGVDKDEATRKKIKELRDEVVKIGQDFSRNIREDIRTVVVNDVSELEGLPADYIARHKPGADGKITLTIEYPDSLPIFSYAKNEQLRKRMFIAYNNRAYPKNIEVLDRLIARRHELANLVGFPHWADYVTADKMVGSAKNASDFIDKIVQASAMRAERDYQKLLKRKQQDVPGATEVNAWESTYYSDMVRKSEY
ncbi:MAG TPA: M3 family metallopeptidase, partial [Blastocatellia bacterium]